MRKENTLLKILPSGDLSQRVGKKLTQEQRNQQRIERMTIAAFDLFTQKGFHKITIESLCSAANVSTRDFYKLIKTKEELLLRVYQRVYKHVENCVTLALANAPEDQPDERLSMAVDALVYAYTDDPRYAQLAYIEVVGVSEEIERLRRDTHNRFADLIRQEFQKRASDTHLTMDGKLPLAIVGACNELILDWLLSQQRRQADQLAKDIKQLYAIVLAGLSVS